MKPIDINYLTLQFRERIRAKNGTEFQTFFEGIMTKAIQNFQKIKPYGRKGDGGNDGYIEASGKYFQVYAPNVPKINEKTAAKKFEDDFLKLQKQWDGISKITEYNFAYNDKYSGSIQLLEAAKKKLSDENPKIKFKLLLAEDLEKIFFSLSEADILVLGFDIDNRRAIKMAYDYLNYIRDELDRENVVFAKVLIDKTKNVVSTLNDDNLSFEFEILECICFQKNENVDEAKNRLENLSKRYPSDYRSLLCLAGIYLNEKNFSKNEELLKKSETINNASWQLVLGKLARKLICGEEIDKTELENLSIPDGKQIQDNYFRILALIYEVLGELELADSFVEKAIHTNPDKFVNRLAKLSIFKKRLLDNTNFADFSKLLQEYLTEIYNIEKYYSEYGDICQRQKAFLNSHKVVVYVKQNNILEVIRLSTDTFQLLLNCYFDMQIEQVLIEILTLIALPLNDFNRLLLYIKNSKTQISDEFANVLIYQFDIYNSLFTEGKQFFKDIHKDNILEFLINLENQDDKKVIHFLQDNIAFVSGLANTLKIIPEFRKIILENLPDNKDILKIKLSVLLNFDEKDVDEAFDIIKQLDLAQLNYIECIPILRIIQNKKAWEFELIILQKLLDKEKDENEIYNLKLQLFNSFLNLNKYGEAISIGEELISEDSKTKKLTHQNKEALLAQTIISCFKRGKIDNEAIKKSKDILLEYPIENPSFEFRAGIETEVYLQNNEPEEAYKTIIDAVKEKKNITPHDYANLNFTLAIKIGNQIDLDLSPLDRVQENSFVKIRNKDKWYYVGTENGLDALQITNSNTLYSILMDSKPGDRFSYSKKYSKMVIEEEIDLIFPIEKYILWQSNHYFQELAKDGILEGVQSIDVPQEADSIDPSFLLQFMEDQNKKTEPIFEMYCKNNIPLSFLALSEGSLINAIGKIQQENKGYINFSSGLLSELEKQKEIVGKVIDEKLPFYIDGTSALFLTEMGILPKIFAEIPNLKVPQSVITFLANVTDRFRYSTGQTGNLGYSQGKLIFSSINKETRELIQAKFISSIKILESNPKNIVSITIANKINCFSESEIPAELCDACILAQKEGIPVLTDDFLYLQMNELETKKKAPSYFSSFSLIRTLYEKGKLSFEEYLDFFGYLSSCRCKFLNINSNDLLVAVFGNENNKKTEPKNIKRFNLPLVLSEDYGVPFQTAFLVVGSFLIDVLLDVSVSEDIAEQIFFEIIEEFPVDIHNKDFGVFLLRNCVHAIENKKKELESYEGFEQVDKKFARLLHKLDFYETDKTKN